MRLYTKDGRPLQVSGYARRWSRALEFRHDESSDGELVFDDGTDDGQDTVTLEFVGGF